MKFMYYGLQSYQRVGSGRAHNSKMSNGRNFRKKIVRRLNKIFGLLNVEALDLEKKLASISTFIGKTESSGSEYPKAMP